MRIKWPNDIYGGGLKIGGALIHTTWQGDRFSVLAGIGLNVSNRQPTTCVEELVAQQLGRKGAAGDGAAGGGAAAGGEASGGAAGSGEAACSTAGGVAAVGEAASSGVNVHIPRGALLAHVLNHLERCYDEFEARGFKGLEGDYLASWMHSGQVVEVEEGAVAAAAPAARAAAAAGGAGGQRVRLTIEGLSETGFLLARDEAGGRWELTPDGNSLDMMVGLIRRKLLG